MSSYPITMAYPATGTVTNSVGLPWPAHNQPIETDTNQPVYTAGDGSIFTVKLGPTRYRITRTFEALTEQEVANFSAFLNAVKFAASQILYQYFDVDAGRQVSVPCKIVADPTESRVMLNMHDITVEFEQLVHPDNVSEAE